MPELPTLQNPTADPFLVDYYDELNRLTTLALDGRIDEDTFRREALRLTIAAYRRLFILAGGDLDAPGADSALRHLLTQATNSVNVLADDIFGGRYSARSDEEAEEGRPAQTAAEGREKLGNRLGLWVYTAAHVYHLGQEYQPPRLSDEGQPQEPTETWHLGGTRDHCSTCAGLNGVTLTVSEWAQLGIRPQAPDLACGGWR